MTRDFRRELADVKCYDEHSRALFLAHGEALEDAALQNREELIALCELIEARGVRSYLEIGAWTGGLVRALHRLFAFDNVAVCDDGYARQFGLELRYPPDADVLIARSSSEAYRRWRARLGHLDLVFIDAHHAYHAVKRDFEINRAFPHRFLAFHDIAGTTRQTEGVRRFWEELDEGYRLEIRRPHNELGLAETTMGIGVWSRTPFDEEPSV